MDSNDAFTQFRQDFGCPGHGLEFGRLCQHPALRRGLAANDPYEPTNRQTLAFNGKIDRYFVIPTVALYFVLVPEGRRRGVHHFLENLTLPNTFVNDVLQGEADRGSQTAGRFLINTTLGLGGFFDPATRWFHMPDHGEDYGQTFAVWGAKEGLTSCYPSSDPAIRATPRALLSGGAGPDQFHPFQAAYLVGRGREYFTLLDLRAQTYQTIQGIQRSSVDYYASLRSLYRQLRDNDIRNGRKGQEDLPDF